MIAGRFSELARRHSGSAKTVHDFANSQKRITEEFPDVVKKSALNLWLPDEVVAKVTRRVLVGVMVSSNNLDIQLLDELDRALSVNKRHGYSVDVLDISACKSPDEIIKYFPSIENILHTPFVAVWELSQHVKTLSGYEGRAFLTKLFSLEKQ